MLLVGANGTRFELRIRDYQFPDGFPLRSSTYTDRNWLLIDTDVVSEQGSWSHTDPSLLTEEIVRLIAWLESVAAGEARESEISFIEPNLSFELGDKADDLLTLQVWFELESRPAWAPSDCADQRDIGVTLRVSPEDVRRAVAELRDHLREFPERTPDEAPGRRRSPGQSEAGGDGGLDPPLPRN